MQPNWHIIRIYITECYSLYGVLSTGWLSLGFLEMSYSSCKNSNSVSICSWNFLLFKHQHLWRGTKLLMVFLYSELGFILYFCFCLVKWSCLIIAFQVLKLKQSSHSHGSTTSLSQISHTGGGVHLNIHLLLLHWLQQVSLSPSFSLSLTKITKVTSCSFPLAEFQDLKDSTAIFFRSSCNLGLHEWATLSYQLLQEDVVLEVIIGSLINFLLRLIQ